jgi:hypothetical protein
MEILESIAWVLTGFIPTLVSLEIGYRMRARSTSESLKRKKEELVLGQGR